MLDRFSRRLPKMRAAPLIVVSPGISLGLVLGNFSSHADTIRHDSRNIPLSALYISGENEMRTKDSTIRFMYYYYYCIAQTTARAAISHIAEAAAVGVRGSNVKMGVGVEKEGRASATRCNPTTTIVVAHIQV